MNIKMFEKLLAVQTVSHNEQAMVDWLVNHFARTRRVTVTVDAFRNVYVRKGNAEFAPCVAAHLDTVQPIRESVSILHVGDRLFGVDKKKYQIGIGADDKAGIFVCLNLLEKFDSLNAVFFAGEEVGRHGANNSDPKFFEQVGCVIEYDCPSRNMLSYSTGGVRLFANGGDFIKTALPVLKAHGTTLWQKHPYTDVMAIRQRFPVSCLNLSCGYYEWHALTEFVSLSDVQLAINQGIDLIKVLGCFRYDCPVDLSVDTDQPLLPIGNLYVPAPV